MKGSDSYRAIWKTIARIPRGKVATYGQIAGLSRLRGQARLVGYALHSLPQSSGIPWHRVINAKGKISFPPSSPPYLQQKSLLEREGITFRNDSVDLDRFRWRRTTRRPRRK